MRLSVRFVLVGIGLLTGLASALTTVKAQDGQAVVWEQRDYGWLPGRLMETVGAKPLVSGNLLYLLTGPLSDDPGLTSETFTAIDCATGAAKWKSDSRFGPTKHELGVALNGGILYLLDRDVAKLIAEARMYGIDQKTGRELWKKPTKLSLLGEIDPNTYGRWPRSYPYPDNFLALPGNKGIVYASAGGGYGTSLLYHETGDPILKPEGGGIIWYYGEKVAVYTTRDKIKATDIVAGADLWSKDLADPPAARPGSGAGLAVGTSVYIVSTSGKLAKFDALSGTVALEKSFEGRGYDGLSFDGKAVLISSSDPKGSLVAVDHAANQEIWRYPNPGRGYRVLLAGGGVIYYGPLSDKGLHAISADNGKKLWDLPLTVEGLEARGDRVFISSGKNILALEPASGKEVWRFEDRWPIRFPVTVDTTTGVVYHGSGDKGGFVYALDGATGKEIWRHKLESSPSLSPIVVAGGSVIYRQVDDKKYGIVRALRAAVKP